MPQMMIARSFANQSSRSNFREAGKSRGNTQKCVQIGTWLHRMHIQETTCTVPFFPFVSFIDLREKGEILSSFLRQVI
jgi:hypothetical protein